jgi:Flp pilus assembly protein TadD
MPYIRTILARTLRLSAFVAAAFMATTAVWADDYGDVNQLMKSGKFNEALGKADQYLAAKPRDPQMRFLKGVIQAESGNKAEAIATYTQLTQDFPELPEPHNNLAVLLAAQGDYDKARVALEAAVRANPNYATAHENLGDVHVRLAGQSYARAQQLDASNQAVATKLALTRQLLAPPR